MPLAAGSGPPVCMDGSSCDKLQKEDESMRSEKPRKTRQSTKRSTEARPANNKKPVNVFFPATAIGSTSFNYLAQDPELADSEAAAVYESIRKQK